MKAFIFALVVVFSSSVYAGCPGGVCSVREHTPVRTVVSEAVNVATLPVRAVAAIVNKTTVDNCCSDNCCSTACCTRAKTRCRSRCRCR